MEVNHELLPGSKSFIRERITKLVQEDRLVDALSLIMEFECDDERLKALWQIHLDE